MIDRGKLLAKILRIGCRATLDEWDGRGWSWDLCRDDAKRLSARKEMLRAMLL